MTIVIGIGNIHRGDDALGAEIVDRIKQRLPKDVTVCTHSGEASSLMQSWNGQDTAVIIDAMCSGAPAGTVRVYDARKTPLPEDFHHTSSHSFGVHEALELARILGELPETVWVIGVEGGQFGPANELSPAIARELERVEGAVLEEIRAILAKEKQDA